MRKSLGVIAISIALVVGYNSFFLRTSPSSNIIEKINPLPYAAHFEMVHSKPAAVFQTPLFPEYNRYCHEKGIPCQFMPWQQLYANILWLGSIQYIGANVDHLDNHAIYTLLDSLTTVSPFRSYPYVFGQLVIPMQKSPLQQRTTASGGEITNTQKASRDNAIALGMKGQYYLCDKAKMAAINELTEEQFILFNSKLKTQNLKPNVEERRKRGSEEMLGAMTYDLGLYKNPCPSYELPHYMGFNYFNNLQDAENASAQYKISAFHDDAPALAATLAALVYGRAGNHLKSATLRYDRYINFSDKDTGEAERSWGKAVFEMQLQLISEAAQEHEACGTSYQCLQQAGAIKQSVQHSWYDLCKQGTITENIRCILLAEGLRNKLIGMDGALIYPFGSGFSFVRSQEYNSWRAQPNLITN